jgi:fructokinase
MLMDVLAIGELLADLISIDYVDSLAQARQFHCFQGGSTANLCANLHWLGKCSRLVAAVGNDGIGKQLLHALESADLNTDSIERSTVFPTSLVLVGRSRATPEFIAYRHADCHIPEVSTEWIRNSKIIHTTAFALSLEPARTRILSAMAEAAHLGKRISCDWNFAPQIWGNDNGMMVFEALSSHGALLKISMDDYERFSGRSNAQVDEAIRFLNHYSFATCCLTAGAEGIWWRDGQGDWMHHAAHPVSQVIDTTGAGDAFWAGFLNQLLDEQPTEQAVLAGAMLAAQKIGQMGPLYSQKNNALGF